jgi:hypothetical protein
VNFKYIHSSAESWSVFASRLLTQGGTDVTACFKTDAVSLEYAFVSQTSKRHASQVACKVFLIRMRLASGQMCLVI